MTNRTKGIRSARRAAVSLIFATALIPLLMVVGLAIDYGLYNEARSQLDMAADASALHAARIAAQLLQKNDASFLTKAEYVGQQWFTGQLGSVPQAHSNGFSPAVNVTYAKSSNLITAQVAYSGVITAHFGSLFPGHWPYYPNWGIAGTATAVVSVPSYVEVLMLLDNSSSMLIAAYADGINKMDSVTPCSAQGLNEKQPLDYNYSWAYTPVGGVYQNSLPNPASAYSNKQAPNAKPATITIPYGYGTFVYPSTSGASLSITEIPPPPTQVGQCDWRFTGMLDPTPIPCPYPGPNLSADISPTTGLCTNGGGGPGSIVYYPGTPAPAQGVTAIKNMPQAPCAFACHTDAGNNDYFGLARSNGVVLRFDVVQDAANQVVTAINSPSNPPGQISVGVYDFNAPLVSQNGNPALTGFTNDYPGGTIEADYNLTGASAAVTSLKPPVTVDQADTDFPLALTSLVSIIKKTNGIGATKGNPRKNLFIVTDGMVDYYAPTMGFGCPVNGVDQGNGFCRVQGPIDAATYCTPIKNLGVTIYVLYTLYQPLPNPFYLTYDRQFAESATGDPPIRTALKQCATSTDDFYEADQSDQIQPALLSMLAAALGSADRLSN